MHGLLSSSASSASSHDETNVASALKAAGDISLGAGEAVAISGSSLAAGRALDVAGASVAVIGATESHASASQSKSSGLFVGSGGGFLSLWGSKQADAARASTSNVASTLEAGTNASIAAYGTDVDILGSSVSAGQGLALSAARDVDVTPGAQTDAASSAKKRSGFGISFSSGNGGFSVGLGLAKVDDTTRQAANGNALSVLKAGGDLTIDAGRDISLQAARASAGGNVVLDARRDVNMLSAADETGYAHMHSQLFAGVSLGVQSSLIGAGEKLANAAKGLGGANGAYGVAPTALAASGLVQAAKEMDPAALGTVTGAGSLASGLKAAHLGSVSLTVGFSAKKATETATTLAPAVTAMRSGGSTAIVGETGNVIGDGVQISAGGGAGGAAGDILLSAGKDIRLSGARSSNQAGFSASQAGAAIGLDLATLSPVASGSRSASKGSNTATSVLDAHVAGSGTVVLQSGADTGLRGAVVSGESVVADVGGDLAIESRRDEATYREAGSGFAVGAGASGVSGAAGRSTARGDFADVGEQSGILAGAGGYHVAVGKGVDLAGGIIASTANEDRNSLSADHLTFSNLASSSASSVSGIGLSAALPAATQPTTQPASGSKAGDAALGGFSAAPSLGQPAREASSGAALATLTPGRLSLSGQRQDLAALNTDLSKADTHAALYDIDRLKAKQQSAAALSQILDTGVGDLAQQLHLPEGSPAKAALHAAVGALVSDLAGGDAAAGALSGAASEIANRVLQQVLAAQPDLTPAQRSAITEWTAAAVGAIAGGQAGAATALDNVEFNYLYHSEQLAREKAKEQLARCERNGDCGSERVASLREQIGYWDNLDTRRDHVLTSACDADHAGGACLAAVTDALKAVEYLRDPTDPIIDPSSMVAGGYADMEMRLVNGRFGGLSNQDLAAAVYAERLQTIALLSRYPDSVQAAFDGATQGALTNAAVAVLTFGLAERLGQNVGTTKLASPEPAAAARAEAVGVGGATNGERLLWSSWNDYPKVTVGGREYAQIGDRLYSRHAVDRMQPSGLGMPIGADRPGRNVTPNMVEEVISGGTATTTTANGVPRTIYTSGNVSVVTEGDGRMIVTILRNSSW